MLDPKYKIYIEDDNKNTKRVISLKPNLSATQEQFSKAAQSIGEATQGKVSYIVLQSDTKIWAATE